MSEQLIIPLNRAEVIKRLKRFREGLNMSRREFGEIDTITQRGEVVGIHTTKHTIYIPLELWNELGTVGEEAVQQHTVTKQAN